MALPSKKTKIVCTIGPASEDRETLEQMLLKGMNVARLNFAHGDFESHTQVIQNLRAAARSTGKRVAIMGDLPGPKMRIGKLVEEPLTLQHGQSFALQGEEIVGNSQRVSCNFKTLPEVVKPGDMIYVNDGFIQLQVESVAGKTVHCRVLVGGELRSFKGVNFPGINLGISAFTDRDLEFLKFAAKQGLDAVSQSFVQRAEDIETVRKAAKALDYHPFIIAKIERAQALDNLECILEVSDGIMVARGDLGVEIPIEKMAITQKNIIRQANIFGKPVITATHMLESMVVHPRPTRAEATDVANAILDGTDCVMLSGETAMGGFPVESVHMMACIAREIEPHVSVPDVARLLHSAKDSGEISKPDLISLSIFLTVEAVNIVAVMSPSLSGATARRVARFRLPVWIIAVSPNEAACQGLQFSYGVYDIHERERPESWHMYAREWFQEHNFTDGLAILTHGAGTAHGGGTNQIEVIDLSNPPDDVHVW
jgi:pyruvate kinase